jgi:hypothetical protein
MSNNPQIRIDSTLTEAVTIYDAFGDNIGGSTLADYFGTLTSLGTVTAGASASFTPIHSPISTYIIYDSHNNPVKRVFTLGETPQTFEVSQSDLDIIAATQNFVELLQNKPEYPEAQQFNALIKDGKGSAQAINAFFSNSSDCKTCTYISYMLVVVALARTPATRNLPPDQQSYSLSTLLQFMGIDWPAGAPDIVLSHFYCTDVGDRILLGGQLNAKDVVFGDGVADHVLSILPSETLRFTVAIDLEPGLAVGSIQLQCVFDTLSVPLGDGSSISFQKPTVLLSITPLFKFVVFEIKATIPFSLFGSPTFDAIAAMTIDNVEAEIGVTLDGGAHTLLTPPEIQGLHFDQFGVGMGLFFEPPGSAVGVQGEFHIGEGQQVVQLDDDTFAVVCEFEGDVPNPLFLSFYVPQLSVNQVVELFTNQSFSLDFPVDFSGMSFHWADNPMEPVTLPDGTLAPMGYGFSADMNLFGLGFYADMKIDLNNGVQGQAQLDPFSLGPVLSLTGDGPGVSIKVDANGNPIPNNTIPRTAAAKQAIMQATSKQLIQPGGAQLRVSTASSPYFTLDACLAFLGLHDSVDASIDKSGISFALDFGGVISGAMACVLQDYHNFSGRFSYGPDCDIPLPVISGLSLGAIHLTAQVDTTLGLSTSTSDAVFTAAAGFNFEGLDCQIGPFDLDIHIAALSDVLSQIESWLVNNVEKVFGDLLSDVGRWARAIYSGAIMPAAQGVAYVVNVLKNSFGQTMGEIGDLLKGSSYALNDVASALKNTFGAAASDVASALTTAYQATANQVASALQAAGYSADQISSALETAFNFTAAAAATVLQTLGYGANQIADAISSAFGLSADAVATVLKEMGYGADQISGALVSAYGASSQAVASALRDIGLGAEDTARALSDVFGLVPGAVNSAMQDAGYAVSDVESGFKAIGGSFASFAESAWDAIAQHFNPTTW